MSGPALNVMVSEVAIVGSESVRLSGENTAEMKAPALMQVSSPKLLEFGMILRCVLIIGVGCLAMGHTLLCESSQGSSIPGCVTLE